MIEKPYEVVVITLQDLKDLQDLARHAPAYREGQAWAAMVMHRTNLAVNAAMIRNGIAAPDGWLFA